MRSRLVIALLAVAACKSKSASDDKGSEPTGGAGNATALPGNTAGSGSAVAAGSGAPDQPTRVVAADGIRPAPTRTDDGAYKNGASPGPAPSAPSAAPAVPTPARPDGIVAARVPISPAISDPVAIAFDKGPDATTLTSEAVAKKIKSVYVGALRRCGDGKGGAVELAFTVNESGRVVAVSSPSAFDPKVASCIVEKATLWVFPVPTSPATASPVSARFGMTFLLRAP